MSQQGPFIVVAHIDEAIPPVARCGKYEDPLDASLREKGLGQVNGGGSLLNATHQVASADIEISLRDLDGALQFVRASLSRLGAPANSLLFFLRDGTPRALDIASGAEFDHPAALNALARRLALPSASGQDEERARVEATAAKILKDYEGLWAGTYEYPPADLSSHPAEWLQWYEQVAEILARQGFSYAADIATVRTDLPTPKTFGFSRKFLAADHLTRADAFQVAAAKPKPPVRVVVLRTDFSDGRSLGTSNAVLRWNVPDFIDDERLPADASPGDVAERHAERLARYRSTNSSAPEPMESLAQLLASEERERVRTRRFRQEQRVPAQGELERLGATPGFAAKVHEAMRRLKAM